MINGEVSALESISDEYPNVHIHKKHYNMNNEL